MNDTLDLVRIVATVASITPAVGNRSGKIKTTDGILLGAYPDKLNLVDEGGTYEFGVTETRKNNALFRDVKTVRPVQTARRQPEPEPEVRHAARSAGYASSAPAAPHRDNGSGGGQYYKPTAPRDSERMFVCSTLNAFIQTGRVELSREYLANAITELRAAYAETFGRDD